MKKEILINNSNYLQVKYIVSRKNHAIYTCDKLSNIKALAFYQNNICHRPCNLGNQFHGGMYEMYMENGKLHNLYGCANINKTSKIKQYYIYGYLYEKSEFNKYVSIYNKLSYKRIY